MNLIFLKIYLMQNLFYIICIFFTIILGCSNEKPTVDDHIVKFYKDVIIIQEKSTILNTDSSIVQHSLDSLFQKYMLTKESFDSIISNYQKNPLQLREFFEKVIKELSNENNYDSAIKTE